MGSMRSAVVLATFVVVALLAGAIVAIGPPGGNATPVATSDEGGLGGGGATAVPIPAVAAGRFAPPPPGSAPTLPVWARPDLAFWQQAEDRSVAEWASAVPVVAEVEVIRVDPVRFNTVAGAFPTQDPTGGLDGFRVFSPVVLRVTRDWRGSGKVGYVVAELGGSRSGFRLDVQPSPVFSANARGVVFLVPHSPSDLAQGGVAPVVGHLVDVANALGPAYGVAQVATFYQYMEGMAVSRLEGTYTVDDDGHYSWDLTTMPVADFEAQLANALP